MEPDSHTECSKGSERFPSPLAGSDHARPPYPLYLAAVVGKLGTTRWRYDKPAGLVVVAGSLLIALLAMPEFNLPALEWVGMFALPLGLFPIPKPSRSGRLEVKNGLTSLLAHCRRPLDAYFGIHLNCGANPQRRLR